MLGVVFGEGDDEAEIQLCGGGGSVNKVNIVE